VPGTEGASGATDYLRSMQTIGRVCRMQHGSAVPLEHSVNCSKSIVLECRCGEKLLLLGLIEDWYSEGCAIFECSGCGEKLSVEDGCKRKPRVPLFGRERGAFVGQTRRLEEERLHLLRLQLEICCENGYEFELRRIKRLIRSVEAELESPVSEHSS
jgi:hypothetical protein